MKLKFAFLLVLIAASAVHCEEFDVDVNVEEQTESDQHEKSEEGIWTNIGKGVLNVLKGVGKELVGKVVNRAGYLVDDVVRVHPTKEAKEALPAGPSHEGILTNIGKFIFNTAVNLLNKSPSHESLGAGYEEYPIHVIEDVENAIHPAFVEKPEGAGHESIHEEPSKEGIFGKLGQLIIKGTGKLIGGTAGNILGKAGDVLGNIFLVQPKVYDVAHPQEVSHEGIFSSIGKVILNGASKVVKNLAPTILSGVGNVVGGLFTTRGAFHGYKSFMEPAINIVNNYQEVFLNYQAPEYQKCLQGGRRNFTELLKEYKRHGIECIHYGERNTRPLLTRSGHIVNKAINQYQFVQNQVSKCLANPGKYKCLNDFVKPMLPILRANITQHAEHMGYVVREVDRYNDEFDECVVRHLKYVRSEGYEVVRQFEVCVDKVYK